MKILDILRHIRYTQKRPRLDDSIYIDWYNTISLCTISYISARFARAVATNPNSFIVYAFENDKASTLYEKIKASILLLNVLLIIDDNTMDDALYELRRNMKESAAYSPLTDSYLLHDGSVVNRFM